MPRRRTPTAMKLLKGTYQPCRAPKSAVSSLEQPNKSVDPAQLPLPPAPRRLDPEIRKVWREIAKKAPHLRKPDQFIVEILCHLMHQFRTEPDIQTARISLINKLLADLWMTPQTRMNIPPQPKPGEYDEF
jgi:hypothetical protein